MKVISGHLTPTNKKHIKAMLDKGITEAKVNTITYVITKDDASYTVWVYKLHTNDYGKKIIDKSKATFIP